MAENFTRKLKKGLETQEQGIE
uniref:Uncharacterized protein n=1 Tax=Rhizophora mucronata TaxID=61149 RepID=A0A2P2J4U4_RHIMU